MNSIIKCENPPFVIVTFLIAFDDTEFPSNTQMSQKQFHE